MNAYEKFIANKSKVAKPAGISGAVIAPHLYPHQADLVRWALRRGRAAVFADTGLGKTAIELEWARNVALSTGGHVLILTHLAVAEQIAEEAMRFNVPATVSRDGTMPGRITITNYEMAHRFDLESLSGIALDESSILKNHSGATRELLTRRCAGIPYRLCATATPAPNDHTELGTTAEFLGVTTRAEMLAEYFAHDGGSTQDWRIKGHATTAFWRWVSSWGAVVRLPSDLGHSDDGYVLPPLRMHESVVELGQEAAKAAGRLFVDDALTLGEQRAVRRATVDRRAARAAEICAEVDHAVVWCDLNDEADAAEAAIPGAVQVSGADTDDDKIDKLRRFGRGEIRVLVTKPKICGFGMNWQHCAVQVFIGPSHSYEQVYQAIRRCWRFGQRRPVDVWTIRTDADGHIASNFARKEADADKMSEAVSSILIESIRADVSGTERKFNPYNTSNVPGPAWAERK